MKKFLSSLPIIILLSATAAFAQDGMHIGSNTAPLEALHVEGAILIGNTTNANTGTIRWNGFAFQGYDGSTWINLGAQGSTYTAGNGIDITGSVISLITHTGDVTGTTNLTIGDDKVTTAKIAANAVTVAKLPTGATGTTFLRGDGTWALPTGTTYNAGTGITLTGTTFSHTAHTGDVTGADVLTIGDDKVTTTKILNDAVTNAKLANMDASTIKGAISAGDPQDLTATQVRTLLNVADGATANAGTVTSVAALTLGTTGSDLNSSVATGTTTPVITLNVPTASAANRGALSAADWSAFSAKESALTFSTGLTRTGNTITSDLSTGIAGGQSVIGGTAAGETLRLSSTTDATKGKILFGTSAYDEVNNRLGIGHAAPTYLIDVKGEGTPAPSTTDNILGRFEQTLAARGAGIQVKGYRNSAGNVSSFIDLTNQSTTDPDYIVARVAALRGNTTEGSLLFYTNNGTVLTERMRISSTGAVNVNALGGNATKLIQTDNLGNLSVSGIDPTTVGTVTGVTGTSPIVSSGGTAPAISIPVATSSANGYLSSTDWTTFNSKQATISTTSPITLIGASVGMVNQGTTTTVLHGNASGNPSFGQIVNGDIANGTINLTQKVTGVLPIANGGTNSSATPTANRIMIGNGTAIVPHAALGASLPLYTDANGLPTTVGPAIQGYWTRTGTNLYNTSLGDNVGIGTNDPQSKLDVSGNIYIQGTGGVNLHYGTYSASTGIREMFRVPNKSLCTGGTFTLSATRGSFVHTSQWSWSSNHPSKGTLKQINGGEYSDIPVYLDVNSNGDVIISANWGAAQTYNVSIQKTAGAELNLGSNNTSQTSAASGYTRVSSPTSIAEGTKGICYTRWGKWGCAAGFDEVIQGRTGNQEGYNDDGGYAAANIECISNSAVVLETWTSGYSVRMMRADAQGDGADHVDSECSICCSGGCYTALGVSTCASGYSTAYTGRTGGIEAYTSESGYRGKTLCIDGGAYSRYTWASGLSTRLMRHRSNSADKQGMQSVATICAVCCK